MSPRAPQFFDADLMDEEQAIDTWRRCTHAIDMAHSFKQAPGDIRVNRAHAHLSALFGVKGNLVRFWVRTTHGNRLAIVGNREGLLPLNVEPIHG